ncbi:hypothetical protein [Candidatus Avelusimicrobium caledoniensis]|uniref:hypothetical protein n=1 Tax=Candidatus Avelusimicrobium caledoniensis TaxID=3416220 RepID=UPI003D1011C6
MRKNFNYLVVLAGLVALSESAAWAQESLIKAALSRSGSLSSCGGVSSCARVGADLFTPRLSAGALNQETILRGVFQARETTVNRTNLFSGTVFQATHNGVPETYVAVAAHALESGRFVLGKTFTADIYAGDGTFKAVPVEIIQVSAPSMLDVAIGKVLEGAEELRPFEISRRPFSNGDKAVSYGFAGQKFVAIENRMFSSKTPLCIRTTMPYPRNDRMGLCGSALLDEAGQLIGIHTGSTYGKYGEADDVGHATDVRLLEVLVEAAYHDGVGTFPLILGGQKVLDMPVDGYISYVRLFNENKKQLWQRGFESKFAYDQVNAMIEKFSPRYIELTTRRVHWDPATPDKLLEIRNPRDKTRRTYRYDFKEGKIIFESKSKE